MSAQLQLGQRRARTSLSAFSLEPPSTDSAHPLTAWPNGGACLVSTASPRDAKSAGEMLTNHANDPADTGGTRMSGGSHGICERSAKGGPIADRVETFANPLY